MADYLPLISRAVANLQSDTPDARRAIYERARAALDQQLRSLDPPLSEDAISQERVSLDDAIARVEAERVAAAMPSFLDQLRAAETSATADEPLPPDEVPQGMDTGDVERPDHDRSTPFQRNVPPAADRDPDPSFDAGDAPDPALRPARPRIDTPAPKPDRSARNRTIVMGAVLGLVIAGIAGIALVTKDRSQAPDAQPRTSQPDAPAGSGDRKFGDRVGGDALPSNNQARAPQQPQQPAQTPAAQGQPGVPVAQRAILYEESAENPRVPVVYNGRAVWRLDSVNVGQGQPAETAIRADVEIPDAGFNLTMIIRRNVDATLPASHLVQLSFATASDARAVRDVGVLQMKQDENARGQPLAGLPVPVTPDVYLIGLSNIRPDVQRNVAALKENGWIDLPVRFASGRRAIIAIERGVSGERTVREAFQAWGQ